MQDRCPEVLRCPAEQRDELAPVIKKTIDHDTTHRGLAVQSLNVSLFSSSRVDASAGAHFTRSPRRRGRVVSAARCL
jgi:hypothetical protein